MPIVMKASDNGFVDATKKIIRLPDYLGLSAERILALRRAAAAAGTAAAAATLSFASLPASGNVVTLTDSGQSAQIDTGGSGLTNLTVSGTNQVVDQWFYYRLSNSTGAMSPINAAINGVTQTFISSSTSTLNVTYGSTTNDPPFDIKAAYSLTGGVNQAALPETITIDNNSITPGTPVLSAPLTIDIIEFNHFNLNGLGQDTVSFSGSPSINTGDQNGPSSSLSEINATPAPNSYQASPASGSTLLNEITASGFTHLTDANTSTSPAEQTWAFEWDFTIPAGSSVQISKNINVTVPEPASTMVMLGGAGLFAARRSRRAKA